MSPTTKRWLADALERAGRTFAQAYFAAWVAFGSMAYETLFTVDNLKAGVVGLAASFAVSLGAKKRGADDSASLLPADVDPPQDPPPLPPRRVAAKKPAAKKTPVKKKA